MIFLITGFLFSVSMILIFETINLPLQFSPSPVNPGGQSPHRYNLTSSKNPSRFGLYACCSGISSQSTAPDAGEKKQGLSRQVVGSVIRQDLCILYYLLAYCSMYRSNIHVHFVLIHLSVLQWARW